MGWEQGMGAVKPLHWWVCTDFLGAQGRLQNSQASSCGNSSKFPWDEGLWGVSPLQSISKTAWRGVLAAGKGCKQQQNKKNSLP